MALPSMTASSRSRSKGAVATPSHVSLARASGRSGASCAGTSGSLLSRPVGATGPSPKQVELDETERARDLDRVRCILRGARRDALGPVLQSGDLLCHGGSGVELADQLPGFV